MWILLLIFWEYSWWFFRTVVVHASPRTVQVTEIFCPSLHSTLAFCLLEQEHNLNLLHIQLKYATSATILGLKYQMQFAWVNWFLLTWLVCYDSCRSHQPEIWEILRFRVHRLQWPGTLWWDWQLLSHTRQLHRLKPWWVTFCFKIYKFNFWVFVYKIGDELSFP